MRLQWDRMSKINNFLLGHLFYNTPEGIRFAPKHYQCLVTGYKYQLQLFSS